MSESEEKQDVKYSLTKITEETNTPRERGAFDHRWSDFGNNDPLAEFMREFKPKTEATTKVESNKVKSDKEKKQVEINRLYGQLYEKDRQFEKAKGKRTTITILVFTVFYFVILMIANGYADISSTIEDISSAEILDILGLAVASILIAWLHFAANAIIFGQLTEIGRSEKAILEDIKKQIREAENSHNY